MTPPTGTCHTLAANAPREPEGSAPSRPATSTDEFAALMGAAVAQRSSQEPGEPHTPRSLRDRPTKDPWRDTRFAATPFAVATMANAAAGHADTAPDSDARPQPSATKTWHSMTDRPGSPEPETASAAPRLTNDDAATEGAEEPVAQLSALTGESDAASQSGTTAPHAAPSGEPASASPALGPTDPDPGGQATTASAGTSAAPIPNAMQLAHEVNENAGPMGQILPEASDAAADSAPASHRAHAQVNDPTDFSAAFGTGAKHQLWLNLVPLPAQDQSSANDAGRPHAPVMDPLHRGIMEAVVELRHERADSLSAVFRPDGQTELVLRLKVHGGRIDALALLQRGDHAALSADWSRLQEKLAQQGVRLTPLIKAGEDFTGSGSQARPDAQQPEELNPLEPVASSRKPRLGASATRATSTRSRHGWECWA